MNLNRRLATTRAFMLIVPLTFALAGCDQQGESLGVGLMSAAPSPLSTTRIVPQILPLIPVRGFRCPVSAPFTTDFDLIVDHRGGTAVFVSQVNLRFVDWLGLGGTPLFFSLGELTSLFGQTFVRSGSSRSFKFRPQFGCGLSVPRSLVAHVVLVDVFGAAHETTLIMPIG